MSNAFLAALAAKSDSPTVSKPVPKLDTSPKATNARMLEDRERIAQAKRIEDAKQDNTPTIELILDRNRIDIFFPRKPEQFVLDRFHQYGWKYRGLDKAWYHQDTFGNRTLLNVWFNAEIETDIPTSEPFAEIIDPVQPKEEPEVTGSPEYVKFKRQVNELISELKIDCADLMLLAVDSLHKAKFGKE